MEVRLRLLRSNGRRALRFAGVERDVFERYSLLGSNSTRRALQPDAVAAVALRMRPRAAIQRMVLPADSLRFVNERPRPLRSGRSGIRS